MNTIEFRGKRLKVVHYNGRLYRADCERFSVGLLASQNYRQAPMKYFTLEKDETYSYSRRGFPFIKTWQTIRPLILIDIFDVPTRNALKELIGASAIDIAFPIHSEGFVYRVSEENTKNKDDDVLRGICEQGVFDGYYMERQQSRENGHVSGFHSEVGLCPHAFNKLQLSEIEKDPNAPPCVKRNQNEKTKKKPRNYTYNNSNKYNKHNNINRNNRKNNTNRNNKNQNIFPLSKRRRINTRIAPPKFSLSMFND
jgi:hypothetical protein